MSMQRVEPVAGTGAVNGAFGPGTDDRMRAKLTPRNQFTASGRRSSVRSCGLVTPVSECASSIVYRARKSPFTIMMTENEKLIDLVKSYPILYDIKNKEYKDIVKKTEAWSDIANKMNMQNGAVAKNKWRHLRDSYAKYLRTFSNPSVPCSKKYKHWTWAGQMEFLKPHVTTRQTDVNSSGNHSESDTETKIKVEPSLEEFVGYYEDSHTEIIMSSPKPRKPPQSASINLASDSAEYLSSGKLQKSMDAVDLLFLSYAQTLKTFSPRRQATVKLQIAQIINNAEIAQLEERDPLQFSSLPSPSS